MLNDGTCEKQHKSRHIHISDDGTIGDLEEHLVSCLCRVFFIVWTVEQAEVCSDVI